MDTLEAIREILKDNLDIDPSKVTLESTFESLNIDSLDLVELVCDLEDKLDIDIGDPDNLKNVGDVVAYIDSLR